MSTDEEVRRSIEAQERNQENLLSYIARTTYAGVKSWVKPDKFNCWLKLRTHAWNGRKPEPGWSSKECDCCGRVVKGCGM